MKLGRTISEITCVLYNIGMNQIIFNAIEEIFIFNIFWYFEIVLLQKYLYTNLSLFNDYALHICAIFLRKLVLMVIDAIYFTTKSFFNLKSTIDMNLF